MTPVRVVVAALLVAVGALVPAAPAAADPTGPCTDASGVTVVVDFQELGHGTYVGCAAQPVVSGFDALTRAGFEYRTTTRFPGFLCRIEDKPETDPCLTTSPANAYWSYWIAPRGGAWCYSNIGAGARVPPPGSVEGWSFAKDKVAAALPAPGIAPPAALPGTTPTPLPGNNCTTPVESPQAPAPAPAPAETAPPAAALVAPPSVTSPPAAASGTNPPAAVAPPTTLPRRSAPRTTVPAAAPSTIGAAGPVDAADPSATETSADEADEDDRREVSPGQPIAATGEAIDFDDEPDASSPRPTIVGVLVVLVVGVGAWFVTRRRRRGAT
jgi:hypothetical protein